MLFAPEPWGPEPTRLLCARCRNRGNVSRLDEKQGEERDSSPKIISSHASIVFYPSTPSRPHSWARKRHGKEVLMAYRYLLLIALIMKR